MSMMTRLETAAQMMCGVLYGADWFFTDVSTDSRQMVHQGLFIALRGDRFDGHAFVETAIEQGACAVVIDACAAGKMQAPACPYIVVDDTRLALGHFARKWRAGFNVPIIAVTGSNGKTTTKEMIACIMRAALGENILVTKGNLNNDIGLPLTLLRLRPEHRAAIVEMGMNHPGEIAYLSTIACPDVALITNVQRAHLEGMGSLEAIATEKGSIFESLAQNGTAVFCDDEPWTKLWQRQSAGKKVFNFSFEHEAPLVAAFKGHQLVNHIDLRAAGDEAHFTLSVPGAHNARNAVAAAAAVLAAGIPVKSVAQGLAAFKPVKGRLQSLAGKQGTIIVDDTYNANPDSVRAAIDALSNLPGRKILVLGDMGEIGEHSAQYHDEVGGYAKSQGMDLLFSLGEASARAASNFDLGVRHFKKMDELISAVSKELRPGTVVLVKGSRFMQMERVVNALVERPEGDTDAS